MRRRLTSFLLMVISALTVVSGTTSGVTAAAVNGAFANPKNLALRPNCIWYNQKKHIQTCAVYSNSMKRNITVHVRPGGRKAIFFLDGARTEDKLSGWLKFTNIVDTFAKDPVTLVLPAGGLAGWYADWNRKSGRQSHIYKWDTFTTKELPAYMVRNFGIRNYHSSILGLSMSAGAAINIAAKHPKLFNTVLAMSGYYQTGSLQTGIIDGILNNSSSLDMWPLFSPKWWYESPSNPSRLVALKRNHTKIVVTLGDSIPYNRIFLNGSFGSLSSYESYSSLSTASFMSETGSLGVPIEFQLSPGNHLWENWTAAVKRNRALLIREL